MLSNEKYTGNVRLLNDGKHSIYKTGPSTCPELIRVSPPAYARDDTIKGVSRSRSATQKDWAEMEAYQLPKEFCVAVVGHKGWCLNGEHSAKYALCVSFEAINKDVEIYVPFVEAEVSIDVEQEIETEIEIPEIRR